MDETSTGSVAASGISIVSELAGELKTAKNQNIVAFYFSTLLCASRADLLNAGEEDSGAGIAFRGFPKNATEEFWELGLTESAGIRSNRPRSS